MRLQRAQLEHAIAILVGAPPSDFSLPPTPLRGEPPELDPGLPARLLERRPDVAAAERRVAAANADIGVARAAYFPTITLDGSLGLESATVGRLFSLPALFWSLGPSATLPLFDAGRRKALEQQANAAYRETVANYRQTVLDAYRDVEDNLAALRQLNEESRTQEAAVAAADRALRQAQLRYTGGIVTYLEVVTAQNASLQAQLTAADIRARRMNAGILLIKAVGGGWTRTALADTGTPAAGRRGG
jgi:NodT family efflux transporter outer membrane factor (OMF) lipoprotein